MVEYLEYHNVLRCFAQVNKNVHERLEPYTELQATAAHTIVKYEQLFYQNNILYCSDNEWALLALITCKYKCT